MQKLKMMFVILFLICLSSCKDPSGYPRIQDQEQLSPSFVYVTIAEEEYISIKKSKCNSRTYRISKGFIGPIDSAVGLNIKECQKIVGRAPREYVVFFNWLESFRLWLINLL